MKAGLVIASLVLSSGLVQNAASGQSVAFRVRELTGQSAVTSPADAVVDFAIESRPIGFAPNVGIGSFSFWISIECEPENAGTLARLRISNGDTSYYTGAPATSTTGGAFAGLAYQYRARITPTSGLENNGLINTSVGNWTNNISQQEISPVRGLTAGLNLLSRLDSDADGIPDTSPLNGSGQVIPEGSVAPLDPANPWFGNGSNWVQLYRFRYTAFTIPIGGLRIRVHIDQPPQVFSTVVYSNGVWSAMLEDAASDVAGLDLLPLTSACSADFDHNRFRNTADLFAFLNAWFMQCIGPASACPRSADFDCNGLLDSQDIFAFLNAWFTEICP